MREFWVASGHHLTRRADHGGLIATPELIMAYLARPELMPPADACDAERRLHASLMADPLRAVTSAEIAALADADARENWSFMMNFRDRLMADDHSVFAGKVYFWLTPWIRDENHMRISHIAEIEHDKGLIWDTLTVESTGGLSPIVVAGLPKGAAQRFVAQVRALMGR